MCDKEHFNSVEQRVDSIDVRVNKIETRISVLESSVNTMRDECRVGFEGLGKQLNDIYSERRAWAEWARSNLTQILKGAGIIILAACGITQATSIIKLIANGFK